MNKSIRILNLPMNIINKLEKKSVFMISDILTYQLSDLGLRDEEQNILEDTLQDYKYRELIKEVSVQTENTKYGFLDLKYTISDLDLSLRTSNALFNNNVTKVSEIITLIEKIEIYDIGSMGAKSIVNLMATINKIVENENLSDIIPIYTIHHEYDDLLIHNVAFSKGSINNLENANIKTLGELRINYLNGKLLDLFSYKTLRMVLDEFKKYYSDTASLSFDFFKYLLIDDYLGEITKEELKMKVNSLISESDDFTFSIDDFIERIKDYDGIIIEGNLLRLPSFKEKLNHVKIKAESEKILLERFRGETLQAVANKFHKTRERIRQIVRDRMVNINMFYEEAFVKEYNKFVWHPQIFKKIYGLDDFSFNIVKYLGIKFSFEEEFVFPEEYVLELIEKGKIEEFDLEEFKNSLPEIFLPRIEIYGKMEVKMTKRVFLEYVIENFVPNKGMHKSKVIQKANLVAKENNLDYHFDKYIDIVTNTVQALQSVRFYDYNKLTEKDIDSLRQIVYEVDSVYSCTYFYIKHQDLMKRLDIRDGYELHYILRRFFAGLSEFDGLVDFNRQPMIAVHGKTFSDVVVETWEKLDGRIDLDLFTNKLVENHGFHSGTLINIINIALGDYISLKVLYNHKPIIGDTVLERTKAVMVDNFYELTELAGLLKEIGIEQTDYQYFSNFWLTDLGYKTHDVNYIIKKDYSSLKEVFYQAVLNEDIYQITEKDHQMRETTLILFIESLREEFLAFLIDKDKLINMRLLEAKGIKESVLKDYVDALNEYVPKNKFFTYTSIIKEKFYLSDPRFKRVEDYKLDNELMIDLIRNIKGIKKTTKGDLFRISKQQTTVGEFLNYVTGEKKITDFEELKEYVKEHYGFVIKKYEM